MNELRDIEGIDPLSWWPPAPGWWLSALLLLLVLRWLWRRWSLRGDWRTHARSKLRQLKRRLGKDGSSDEDAGQVLVELSMLLRRAAIARFGRRRCAGLSGPDWLAFLSENDPGGFDWTGEAALMVELPYAPAGMEVEPAQVRKLIGAARAWVNKPGPKS